MAKKKASKKPTPDFSVVSVNGSRSLVEVFYKRRYLGTLKMSLEESESFLKALKTAGVGTRNKKSIAAQVAEKSDV